MIDNKKEFKLISKKNPKSLLPNALTIFGVCLGLSSIKFAIDLNYTMAVIAIGFAAKDLLSNFFGGLFIYLDRPFAVGDWIRSPDREIEGTVEQIGWRVTRIRTFDKRPLYIPNSVFSQISV